MGTYLLVEAKALTAKPSIIDNTAVRQNDGFWTPGGATCKFNICWIVKLDSLSSIFKRMFLNRTATIQNVFVSPNATKNISLMMLKYKC